MEETIIKRITAGEFLSLDRENVTVLDLRESDEVLVKKLGGAATFIGSGEQSDMSLFI